MERREWEGRERNYDVKIKLHNILISARLSGIECIHACPPADGATLNGLLANGSRIALYLVHHLQDEGICYVVRPGDTVVEEI